MFESAETNCTENSTLLYNTIASADIQDQVNSMLAVAILSLGGKQTETLIKNFSVHAPLNKVSCLFMFFNVFGYIGTFLLNTFDSKV